MRRTNIYLTQVQLDGFRRLTARTGLSMAALMRTAVNHMLAKPERFPELKAALAVEVTAPPKRGSAADGVDGQRAAPKARRAPRTPA